MLRRNFFRYTSAVAALVLLPLEAKAAVYNGPLWIFVQASGGWDPTSFCDPKGYNEILNASGNLVMQSSPMNKTFKKSDIRTNSRGVKYAPLVANDGVKDYNFADFFENNADDLLVINGIDTQTNGHSSGRRYMMSGKLAEGYPALSALIAGVYMPTAPLAFVTAGGYDVTDGVVAGTRLSNMNVINELAFVNKQSNYKGKTINYKDISVFNRILKAREDRTLRVINRQKLESVKALAKQYNIANSGSNELAKLVKYIPDDINTHEYRRNDVFAQGRFAMAGYRAGLTTSVNINIGGFDTHGNHDNAHIPRLARLFKGIELLKEDAQKQGILDRVVFIIGSEFGRTPGYNKGNGKDHWSVNSMMFLGNAINKKGVIGETSDRHVAKAVNANSLNIDENGIKITYAHIHKALRTLAGIQSNKLLTKYYPLPSNIEELNLFG